METGTSLFAIGSSVVAVTFGTSFSGIGTAFFGTLLTGFFSSADTSVIGSIFIARGAGAFLGRIAPVCGPLRLRGGTLVVFGLFVFETEAVKAGASETVGSFSAGVSSDLMRNGFGADFGIVVPWEFRKEAGFFAGSVR